VFVVQLPFKLTRRWGALKLPLLKKRPLTQGYILEFSMYPQCTFQGGDGFSETRKKFQLQKLISNSIRVQKT